MRDPPDRVQGDDSRAARRGGWGAAWAGLRGPPARTAAESPVSPELLRTLQWEQLSLVWLHAGSAMLMANAFAVLGALQLSEDVPAGWALHWIALKLAVAVGRLLLARRFEREHGRSPALTPPPAPAQGHDIDLRHWRWATHGGLALDGAVWGVAGLALMGGEPAVASLTLAGLAGVACVATFGLQVSPVATASYVVPILAPTALALLWRGDSFGAFGGGSLLILLLVQLSTARRMRRRLQQAIVLRQHTQSLVQERGEALRQALEQSAFKSRFLGAVSHELRTPLHGIMGMARLMHLDSAEPQQRQRIELIESSGQHLLGLISDLLDMSLIEEQRFVLRDEVFELGAQVRQVIGLYEVRAEEKGLTLRTELNLQPPVWVRGDATRLRQVLHNLLGNAVKFTQRGGVVLRVAPCQLDAGQPAHDPAEGECWAFEVEDSGPGIAEADQARVFEAFERADAAHRSLEGSGLGLRIARVIAQQMHGDLTLRSAPGHGSCFLFTARLPHVGPGVGAAQVTVAPTSGRAVRVLLAEDDNVHAMIAEAFLDRLGVLTERVADGREAVRRALRDSQRPDLVLMDCRMPVMDGYEATLEIRRREAALGLPRLPIVALTATVTAHGRAQCLEAGMDDFLSKPFTLEDLQRVLPPGDRPAV